MRECEEPYHAPITPITSKDHTRKALGFIYYAEFAQLDEKAAAEYQRRLTEQLAQEGKISFPRPCEGARAEAFA